MSDNLEKISVDPYLVVLKPGDKRIFANIREWEMAFLKKCREAGARIVETDKRTTLVVAPGEDTIRAVCEALEKAPLDEYQKWFDILKSAAKKQGKRIESVGVRSARPPKWILGQRGESDNPPGWRAERITYSFQNAKRGGQLSLEEAIAYLATREEEMAQRIENSKRHHQRERVERQETLREELIEDLEKLREIYLSRSSAKVSVYIKSGRQFLVNVTATEADGKKFRFRRTIPNIAIVPAIGNVAVEPSKKRSPHRRHDVVVYEMHRVLVYLKHI